jgi:hypothetical protein
VNRLDHSQKNITVKNNNQGIKGGIMEKVFYGFLGLVLITAGYFLGVQSGQHKMQGVQQQQMAMQRAESISQHIQYATLLNLGKTDELALLLRSRILAEKTQLEMDLANPDLMNNRLLKDAINTADSVLSPGQP